MGGKNIRFWLYSVGFLGLFFYCLAVGGCNQSKEESLEIASIKIDPDDTTSVFASDIFDRVEYIPLEAGKESQIGEITKIEITPDFFFIMDKITNSLFIFNHSGDFIRKIASVSPANDTMFIKLVDFTIDSINKEIIVLDSYAQKLVRFNFSGEKLGVWPMKMPIYNLFIKGSFSYVYKNYAKEKSSTSSNLVVLDKNADELRSYLAYNPQKHTREDLLANPQHFYRSRDKAYFSQPFSYVLYELSGDGIVKPAFKVVLPEQYQIPKDFLINDKYNQKRKSFFVRKENQRYMPVEKNKKLIWSCTDVFFTQDSTIAFTLVSMDNLSKCILFDYKSKRMYNIENIGSIPKSV